MEGGLAWVISQEYTDLGPGVLGLFLSLAFRIDEVLEPVPGTVILAKFMR